MNSTIDADLQLISECARRMFVVLLAAVGTSACVSNANMQITSEFKEIEAGQQALPTREIEFSEVSDFDQQLNSIQQRAQFQTDMRGEDSEKAVVADSWQSLDELFTWLSQERRIGSNSEAAFVPLFRADEMFRQKGPLAALDAVRVARIEADLTRLPEFSQKRFLYLAKVLEAYFSMEMGALRQAISFASEAHQLGLHEEAHVLVLARALSKLGNWQLADLVLREHFAKSGESSVFSYLEWIKIKRSLREEQAVRMLVNRASQRFFDESNIPILHSKFREGEALTTEMCEKMRKADRKELEVVLHRLNLALCDLFAGRYLEVLERLRAAPRSERQPKMYAILESLSHSALGRGREALEVLARSGIGDERIWGAEYVEENE